MDWMYANCSTTAQRGALDWWPHFYKATKPVFNDLYDAVADGSECRRTLDCNSRATYVYAPSPHIFATVLKLQFKCNLPTLSLHPPLPPVLLPLLCMVLRLCLVVAAVPPTPRPFPKPARPASSSPHSPSRPKIFRLLAAPNPSPRCRRYAEDLEAELKTMRESEMWRAGVVVRGLRPENN